MSVSDFVVTLTSSGALVWLLQGWIGERLKNSIKHEYEVELAKLKNSQDAELEIHKAALQAESEAVIERLKSDLQIAAVEHQIRFSKLHDKVAENAVGVWLRLKKVVKAVGQYTSELETPSMGSQEDRRIAMAGAMKEFRVYFFENCIYLSSELNSRIDELVKFLRDSALDFQVGVEKGGDRRDLGEDTWTKVRHDMEKIAKPLFEGLEAEIRWLLGVEEAAASGVNKVSRP